MALRWVTGSEDSLEEVAPKREIGRWTALFSIILLIVPLIVILVGWTPMVDLVDSVFSSLSEAFDDLVKKLGEISLPSESEEPVPVQPVEEPDLSTIE
jgi:hypothetical protein